MQLIDLRALTGPNLYSLTPVILMELDLEDYQGVESREIGDFNERLLHAFPTLKEHYCSYGEAGGFLRRLEEGTYLGHILEHLVLELQNLCGDKVSYGSTRRIKEGEYRIICEYNLKEAALTCATVSLKIMRKFLAGEEIDLREDLLKIKKIYRERGLGPSTKELVLAAQKKGIPVMVLDAPKSLVQFGYGEAQHRMAATISDRTPCLGVDIASDKVQTKKILKEMNLPVARGLVVKNREEVLEALKLLTLPVVLKPCNGNQGYGVLAGLRKKEEVLEAMAMVQKISPNILLEEHIEGRDYRILVVNKKVVAVAERKPPQVTGDGEKTIEALIQLINGDPKRGIYHEKPLTRIPMNQFVLFHLSCQGYTLSSVPPKGEEIILQQTGNLSCGGEAKDVTATIHPENSELAVEAVSYLGLDIAGVDVITPHIAIPLKKKGAIIEINAAPGLRMHHFPTKGKSQNVSKAVMDMLFPGEEKGKIPLIAVTGTNGKTTITRLISFMLQKKGLLVGSATSEGIFFNQKLVKEGDMTGPYSARFILRHPKVQAGVLETARGGILREGLGFSSCKLALISNISQDHLGQYSINSLAEMAHLKSLLLELVDDDGFSILNVDDPLLVRLSSRARGEILFTSQKESNPYLRDHLSLGGQGVYLDSRGEIILAKGEKRERLLHVKDVPLTLNGIASHQIENVLLSTASAFALGLSIHLIKVSLKDFQEEEHNPGRLNMFSGGDILVILDYAHNIEGYRQILQTVSKLGKKRLVGVIGMPGDREDQDIIKVGQLTGSFLEKIYVKEDAELRGRRPTEVANLLIQGILSIKGDSSYELILDEREALKKAIFTASPGDVVLIFYEKKSKDWIHLIKEALKERESMLVYP